jgi:hypothetical protein
MSKLTEQSQTTRLGGAHQESLRASALEVKNWMAAGCKGEVPRTHIAMLRTFADVAVNDWFMQEAYRRHEAGEPYSTSTGLCGSLTAGYEIDDYGYFKYPLQINPETFAIIPIQGETK